MSQEIFVEQAEYIETDAFNRWTVDHPEEDIIISKLSNWGAKLITGPRGCGKTTLMLKTYYKMCSPSNKKTLAIYVNFKSSLKVEPLYKTTTNAVYWFNQWMLFKVYQGLLETMKLIKVDAPRFMKFSKKTVESILSSIEFGMTDSIREENMITIEQLEEEILKILEVTGKKHCILLLDDASHAFSSDQQKDFFDFFRQIKSKYISPKAAVYSGVTVYASTFHVGHDAEEINVWIRPDRPEYIEFMVELLKRRLPEEVFDQLYKKQALLEVVCYSAFGMPRSLLNIVRHFYKDNSSDDQSDYKVNFNTNGVKKAISDVFKQNMKIYTSLKVKLPTYERFIDTGQIIFEKICGLLKEYNRGKEPTSQSVTISINRPIPIELQKVLGFFQYGGLLMPKGELSKGEKGVFEQYFVHYGALVERNAFIGKQSISSQDLLTCMSKRNAHAFTRISPTTLIGTDISSAFPLSLPPCSNCKSPRISEHSKFCNNCGAQLKSVSVFETILAMDISELPLTENRVNTIKEHSSIRTIKDILMDNGNKELRKVPQVGPFWAQRIYSYAEEFIV